MKGLKSILLTAVVLSVVICLVGALGIQVSSAYGTPLVSREEIEAHYKSAEKWFLGSINDKGIFNYLYDTHENSFSSNNNAIRQLMGSRLLAELAALRPELRESHRKNLEFIFHNWAKKAEGVEFVLLYGKSQLGANAMLLRTLLASPFLREFEGHAEKLKDGVLRDVHPDGSMHPFLVEPGYAYDQDYLLTFYSGEALLALIEYYEHFKDPKLLEIIRRSAGYYIDRYVTHLSEHYYPAYVPWHTMALNKLYKLTHDSVYADAIFALNDKLLEIQDRSQHFGRFFNPATPQYGSPHSSSDGVYIEGLSYALEIAEMAGDQHRIAIYREAVQLGLSYIFTLQYTAENSKGLPSPEKAIGGIRISRRDLEAPFSERAGSNIRIDCVQHSMDAMRKYLSL